MTKVSAFCRPASHRLRAERKAGQLLRDMEKAKAGRPPQNRSTDTTDYRGGKTLRELGISKDQSSKWQKLAAVPEAEFEAAAPIRSATSSPPTSIAGT